MSNAKHIVTLGNGQLGLLLGKAAKRLNISFVAYSLSEAWEWLEHRIDDEAHKNTLVTFEQEHVDEDLLKAIQDKGLSSFPRWEHFRLLKSKRAQKLFLQEHKVPTSPFLALEQMNAAAEGFIKQNKGAVLKAGKGGYDGKGVWLVNDSAEVAKILPEIADAYLEKKIAFDYEIAAVVCRSSKGEVFVYPAVRSIQKNGICTEVEYTQEFAQSAVAKKAGKIAQMVAEKIDYVGVLAVELFVCGEDVFVNEIAPRVHNSGHFTIDVCAGSQFENHLRAGLGMELVSSPPTHPAALMVNLLWPPEQKEFAPLYTRLSCGPEWPENAKLHWYGKSEIRPYRKMGHFTVYGKSLAECRALAQQILASRWA